MTFDLKLNDFQKGFVDTTKQDTDRGVNRGLMYMGGFIRTVAKRSIKPAARHPKKAQAGFLKGLGGEVYSQPGQPPLSKIGLLRDNIFYAWVSATRSVVIGPAKLNGRGNVPAALELGGPCTTTALTFEKGRRKFVLRTFMMRARPYMRPALKEAMKPKNLAKFFAKLTTQETISISV